MRSRRVNRRRPRLRGSRKGAASAIAVLFVILIVVALINTYLATTLPQQMAADEFQQTLAVQSSFVQLQSDILGEAANPGAHVVMNTPVQLQSGGEPPFGAPSTSTISSDPTASSLANLSYNINITKSYFVGWNDLSICGKGQSQSCTGNNGQSQIYDNSSYNGTTVSLSFNGCGASGCNVTFNVNGSNDIIDLSMQDSHGHPAANNTYVIINGNDDQLFLTTSGAKVHRGINAVFFGEYDSFNAYIQATSYVHISTVFIGEGLGASCPLADKSTTDRYIPDTSTGTVTGAYQNVTWWHASGTNSQTVPYSPFLTTGSSTNDWYQSFNRSGVVPCAFETIASPGQAEHAIGGFFDTLNNRYFPSQTIAFEEGAIIDGISSTNSTMISGPPLTILHEGPGLVVNLTLVQLISNSSLKSSGGGTADIQTHLISTSLLHFYNTGSQYNSTGLLLAIPYYLTIVTEFPNAWISFFEGYSSMGVFATPQEGACYSSNFGPEVCPVVVPVYSNGFNIEIATVGISLL